MKKFFLFLFFALSGMIIVLAQDLVVGSYNIRNNNSSDNEQGNGWDRRCPFVAQQILFYDFDFLGAQEVVHKQLEDLLQRLPQYGFVGVGRDDGKTGGEYAPIFYKKNRFKLMKSGHFWLSEQTDVPNKGWDAAYIRVCSWGQFRDLTKKKNVWVFNTHFDNVGVEARKQSALLIMSKIKALCDKEAVIFMGDLNVPQTNESYTLFADSKFLYCTYETADVRYVLNGTFNGFRASRASNVRIDHIFVSDKFKVNRFGVLTETYRTPAKDNQSGVEDFPAGLYTVDATIRTLSDHYPIMATLDYLK